MQNIFTFFESQASGCTSLRWQQYAAPATWPAVWTNTLGRRVGVISKSCRISTSSEGNACQKQNRKVTSLYFIQNIRKYFDFDICINVIFIFLFQCFPYFLLYNSKMRHAEARKHLPTRKLLKVQKYTLLPASVTGFTKYIHLKSICTICILYCDVSTMYDFQVSTDTLKF